MFLYFNSWIHYFSSTKMVITKAMKCNLIVTKPNSETHLMVIIKARLSLTWISNLIVHRLLCLIYFFLHLKIIVCNQNYYVKVIVSYTMTSSLLIGMWGRKSNQKFLEYRSIASLRRCGRLAMVGVLAYVRFAGSGRQ